MSDRRTEYHVYCGLKFLFKFDSYFSLSLETERDMVYHNAAVVMMKMGFGRCLQQHKDTGKPCEKLGVE